MPLETSHQAVRDPHSPISVRRLHKLGDLHSRCVLPTSTPQRRLPDPRSARPEGTTAGSTHCRKIRSNGQQTIFVVKGLQVYWVMENRVQSGSCVGRSGRVEAMPLGEE